MPSRQVGHLPILTGSVQVGSGATIGPPAVSSRPCAIRRTARVLSARRPGVLSARPPGVLSARPPGVLSARPPGVLSARPPGVLSARPMKSLLRTPKAQAVLAVILGCYLSFALRTTRWTLDGQEHL